MRAPKASSATSSANATRPAVTLTGRRRIRSSSVASSPMPTPRSQVSYPDHVIFCDLLQVSALIPSSPRLGVVGPDPSGCFPSRHRLGEREGEYRCRTPPVDPKIKKTKLQKLHRITNCKLISMDHTCIRNNHLDGD